VGASSSLHHKRRFLLLALAVFGKFMGKLPLQSSQTRLPQALIKQITAATACTGMLHHREAPSPPSSRPGPRHSHIPATYHAPFRGQDLRSRVASDSWSTQNSAITLAQQRAGGQALRACFTPSSVFLARKFSSR
jgi:hypothetical protein